MQWKAVCLLTPFPTEITSIDVDRINYFVSKYKLDVDIMPLAF